MITYNIYDKNNDVKSFSLNDKESAVQIIVFAKTILKYVNLLEKQQNFLRATVEVKEELNLQDFKKLFSGISIEHETSTPEDNSFKKFLNGINNNEDFHFENEIDELPEQDDII